MSIEPDSAQVAALMRDYGFWPTQDQAVPEVVRSRLTPGNIFGQWLAFVLFAIGPVLLGLLLLAVVPVLVVRLGLGAIFCGMGLIFGYLIAFDVNEWVEVDGQTLRWKHLFWRTVQSRNLHDLGSIETLTLALQTLTAALVRQLLGRVKGFEFRFREPDAKVRVFRTDPTMTNIRELLGAVCGQLRETHHIRPEVEEMSDGMPVIRRLVIGPKT